MMVNRRQFLQSSGMGFGAVALNWMLHQSASGASGRQVLERPHHAPRAKSVIFLTQSGGASQMDLFDPKPVLQRMGGKTYVDKVEMFQPGSETNVLLESPWTFKKYGDCGMDFSDALPHTASHANDICMVRSMYTEHNNHGEALVMMTSGDIFPGRPTWGSWISYGLGSENDNLPAFVVLRDPDGYPGTGATLWQNGWLPAVYRGTEFNSQGSPLLNLAPHKQLPTGTRETDLEFLQKFNRQHQEKYPQNSLLDARIQNYEMAARMQVAAMDILDIEQETESTKKLFGLDNANTAGYGRRLLMARRMVESGVRFVQVFAGKGNPWDSHTNVDTEIKDISGKTDLPVAGLLTDLKQRGLLDETIIVWTGEFGRLPVSQNGKGRDHNRNGFSLLLAGGGFKPGYIHGRTDDVGYKAVEARVSVPDLFATIMNQLGIDHDELTYEHHGRLETPTDSVVTGAAVVHELLGNV